MKTSRNLFESDKEFKNNVLLDHTLLGNEVYLYHNKPVNWKTEHVIEINTKPSWMKAEGIKVAGKKVISDPIFTRNGYRYVVEIDNTRTMQDNKKA